MLRATFLLVTVVSHRHITTLDHCSKSLTLYIVNHDVAFLKTGAQGSAPENSPKKTTTHFFYKRYVTFVVSHSLKWFNVTKVCHFVTDSQIKSDKSNTIYSLFNKSLESLKTIQRIG
jgi:hypothetical protein